MWSKYIKSAAKWRLRFEPPDINVSAANFTPHGEAIRFGLAAVKNVAAMRLIPSLKPAQRKAPSSPIFDFCERVDLRLLNKRVLESFSKSGRWIILGIALAAAPRS